MKGRYHEVDEILRGYLAEAEVDALLAELAAARFAILPARPRHRWANGESVSTFWHCVDRSDEDGCWPWIGGALSGGYGRARHKGRRVLAHRLAYALANGIEVEDLTEDVDHDCHNRDRRCPGGRTCRHRACCNPAHLRELSRSANVQAAYDRKRS